MSVYLSFDDGEPEDFASNRGWADLSHWAERLPPGDFPELARLVAYGWSQDVPALRSEVGRAVAADPPDDPAVAATAGALLAAVTGRDAAVVTATNGVTAGGRPA